MQPNGASAASAHTVVAASGAAGASTSGPLSAAAQAHEGAQGSPCGPGSHGPGDPNSSSPKQQRHAPPSMRPPGRVLTPEEQEREKEAVRMRSMAVLQMLEKIPEGEYFAAMRSRKASPKPGTGHAAAQQPQGHHRSQHHRHRRLMEEDDDLQLLHRMGSAGSNSPSKGWGPGGGALVSRALSEFSSADSPFSSPKAPLPTSSLRPSVHAEQAAGPAVSPLGRASSRHAAAASGSTVSDAPNTIHTTTTSSGTAATVLANEAAAAAAGAERIGSAGVGSGVGEGVRQIAAKPATPGRESVTDTATVGEGTPLTLSSQSLGGDTLGAADATSGSGSGSGSSSAADLAGGVVSGTVAAAQRIGSGRVGGAAGVGTGTGAALPPPQLPLPLGPPLLASSQSPSPPKAHHHRRAGSHMAAAPPAAASSGAAYAGTPLPVQLPGDTGVGVMPDPGARPAAKPGHRR